jgi:hypothetical protein
MKNLVRISIYFLCAIGALSAGNFKSQVVQVGNPLTIDVSRDRFLVIRNFTQEGPATKRGSVSVMTSTFTAQEVITATILDPNTASPGSLEPINNVVIAGPATVTVNAGDTNCFITYRQSED